MHKIDIMGMLDDLLQVVGMAIQQGSWRYLIIDESECPQERNVLDISFVCLLQYKVIEVMNGCLMKACSMT